MAEYITKEQAVGLIEQRQKELCPVGRYGRNYVYGSDREKYDAWEEIIDEIENMPAADVAEVVRCRECKCWKPSGGYAGDNINDLQRLGGCKWAVACVRENDFCNRGQRKEDKQDAN